MADREPGEPGASKDSEFELTPTATGSPSSKDSDVRATAEADQGYSGITEAGNAEEVEAAQEHWFRNVYQGDKVPQLTLRAILIGGILGSLMSISNLYTSIKLGWAFGVAITACVLSFVIWNSLRTIFPKLTPMSILENNCMQSTASAAGYSTGATVGTAFGALLLITGAHVDWKILCAWTFVSAALGVFLAVPMKRQMINVEGLPFPSGIAAAQTLKSLHGQCKEAIAQAHSLVASLTLGIIVGFLGKGEFKWQQRLHLKFPDLIPFNITVSGIPLSKMPLFGFEPSVLLIGAGMIVGLRVSISMLIGSLLLYVVIGPYMLGIGEIAAPAELIKSWSLWTGTALMVTSGLAAFAVKWKTILNAVSGIKLNNCNRPFCKRSGCCVPCSLRASTSLAMHGSSPRLLTRLPVSSVPSPPPLYTRYASHIGRSTAAPLQYWQRLASLLRHYFQSGSSPSELGAVEVPFQWLAAGLVPLTIAMVLLQYVAFSISIPLGFLAVIMSALLALVACRATGETDITPIGAMGKITQLLYAKLIPSNVTANLMAASVTANIASSSADLLTDLKSGYLLGANPRKQFLAQFAGVFFGTIAIIPAWYLMVPSREVLDKLNPPSALMWKAVAEALSHGVQSIPEFARIGLVAGGLLGIVMAIADAYAPKKWKKFLPSAMGLGLSWVVPFANCFSFFIGALIAYVWSRVSPKSAGLFVIPVASGAVAGESLICALIAMYNAASALRIHLH